MKLSKTWKYIIGLSTAWIMLYPLMFVALYFFFVFGSIFSVGSGPEESVFGVWIILISIVFFVFFILQFFTIFLQMGLSGFYLYHAIRNQAGSEILRTLLAMGSVYMPYIAMPIYFFAYIWPDEVPKWARSSQSGTKS